MTRIPLTRIGVCGKCKHFDLLYKIVGVNKYRCSTCFKLETGVRHWLVPERRKETDVERRIRLGDVMVLTNILPMNLRGIKVVILSVEKDEKGNELFDVKLLGEPLNSRFLHEGDITSVYSHHLQVLEE